MIAGYLPIRSGHTRLSALASTPPKFWAYVQIISSFPPCADVDNSAQVIASPWPLSGSSQVSWQDSSPHINTSWLLGRVLIGVLDVLRYSGKCPVHCSTNLVGNLLYLVILYNRCCLVYYGVSCCHLLDTMQQMQPQEGCGRVSNSRRSGTGAAHSCRRNWALTNLRAL